ncbi:MAG TPA: hypothetical protein VGC99_01785 [Candidatus Tectomicrobia bacterium]
MNDYLSDLAARSLSLTGAVRPRLASWFELPVAANGLAPGPLLESERFDMRPKAHEAELDDRPPPRPFAPPLIGRAPEPRWHTTEHRLPLDAPHQPPHVPIARTRSLETSTAQMASQSRRPVAEQPTLAPARPADGTDVVPFRNVTDRPREAPLEPAISLSEPSGILKSRPLVVETMIARPREVPHVEPKATPAIHVTIGRIEVRAVMRPAPPAPRPRPTQPVPLLSLEDYLKQRNEGRR